MMLLTVVRKNKTDENQCPVCDGIREEVKGRTINVRSLEMLFPS